MSEQTTRIQTLLFEQSSPLLPAELEAQRLGALGAEYPVKGDPRTPPGNPPRYKDCRDTLGELEAVRQSMFNPYDIHAESEGPGRLALIRKGLPHGMHEMTVMAQDGYNGEPVDNLFGFAPEIRRSFYEVGAAFSRFSEADGLYPILSYTYDPETKDRKPPQSVKTFHLQLTARSQQELDEMAERVRPLDGYGSVLQRRQLVDESSIAYSLALHDYFTAYPVGSFVPVAPFTEDGCSNLRFRIGSDWNDILTEEFDKNLATIHQTLTNMFADFADATMSGTTGVWQRPTMNSAAAHDYIDGLEWMRPGTKEILQHFISGLRVRHLQRAHSLQELGLTSHVYPVANFCYGAAINKNDNGELMLSIRPQFFAGGGGTGLQYLDPIGAQVMITKGSGKYDDHEVCTKEVFERRCAGFIIQRSGLQWSN